MKRKHVIGIIVIVLLVAAVFTGRYIYKERYSDEMKKSLPFAAPLINKYSIKQQAAQKESFVCVYKNFMGKSCFYKFKSIFNRLFITI